MFVKSWSRKWTLKLEGLNTVSWETGIQSFCPLLLFQQVRNPNKTALWWSAWIWTTQLMSLCKDSNLFHLSVGTLNRTFFRMTGQVHLYFLTCFTDQVLLTTGPPPLCSVRMFRVFTSAPRPASQLSGPLPRWGRPCRRPARAERRTRLNKKNRAWAE